MCLPSVLVSVTNALGGRSHEGIWVEGGLHLGDTSSSFRLTYVLCGGTAWPGSGLVGVAVVAPTHSMTVEKADNPLWSHEGRRLLRCPMVRAWPAALKLLARRLLRAGGGALPVCVCVPEKEGVSRPSIDTQKTCQEGKKEQGPRRSAQCVLF